ncbi:hypothetical protein M3Y97_00603700 [Aphelenchoides bicaudatus]|nr:hypothetical protein M3Y97_00603700 [Aphelenchoides bicaudatus]
MAEQASGKKQTIFEDPDSHFVDNNDQQQYKSSGLEKWINILLCRGDLASETFESPPVSFVQLFRFGSKKDQVLVLTGILIAVFTGISQPFAVFLGGKLANVLIAYGRDGDKEKLWHEGYLLVIANLVVGTFVVSITFVQYFCLKYASIRITANLRYKFMESVLRQDACWFDTQKFGAINSQLNDGIQKISDGIGDKIGLLIRGISMFLTTMIISFVVNWQIALLMVGTGPACCLTMSLMARMINRSTKKQLKSYELGGSILQECVMNVKTVQSCNGQNQMVRKLEQHQNDSRIHGILTYVWNGLFDGIFFFLLYFFYAFGIYYGGIKYFKGEVEAGDVFIVVNAITMGGYFLGLMSPHIMSIMKARVSAAVIYERIDRVPNIDCYSSEGKTISNPRGLVSFKEVSFAYPGRLEKLVLDKVSWEAQPGEIIALVGHSGCGKSTSMGLLTHLYQCTGGQVCIDGEDIKDLNISHLRKLIGIVQQEPVLFHGTIFENIRLGDPEVSFEDVKKACRLANADTFISKLENQYDTFVGTGGGIQLSGGQKQRLAIARAILKNPPILLLDEATSALDAESEILVQTALREAAQGRTTIIIAHRLSTLRDVQKIIVLDEGKVVECGKCSHADLVAKEGLYASLVKAQQFQQTQEVKQEEKPLPPDLTSLRRSEISTMTSTRSSIRDPSTLEFKAADEEIDESFDRFFSGGLFRTLPKLCWSLLEAIWWNNLFNASWFGIASLCCFNEYGSRMFWFVLASLAIGLYSTLTIFGSVSLYGWLTEEVADALKVRALRNILRQGSEYFDRPETSNAKLLQRISTDTTTLKAALDIRLYHQVNNVFCCLVEVVVAFVFCWQITMAGLGVYCFLFVLLGWLAKQMRWNIRKITELDDSANYSVEIIENTRTIQLLTKESYFLSKFDQKIRSFWAYQKNVAIYDSVMFAFTQCFFFFSDCTCYGLGLYLIYHGLSTPSQVFVASQCISTMSWAILFVSTSFNEILHAIPAIDSVLDIVTASTCIDDHEEDGIEPDVVGDLSVEKVVFAYPTRPQVNVANGLILRARRGESIALVGPSGGGKSTIIQLLERYYEPKNGQITVDRSAIRRFKLKHLRNQMALVAQEPVLFSGTIKDNITLGVENATLEDIHEAARVANAYNFITKLPQGFETLIGEKGSILSGGQKQRLAIARALVRKPKILLLDEATSALDAASEKSVQQGLDSASAGRTCIIIAHRLSSIQHVDKIYFISNGRVVEQGTHNELMAENSLYAELIKKQDLRS